MASLELEFSNPHAPILRADMDEDHVEKLRNDHPFGLAGPKKSKNKENVTSLANWRWPTRPEPIDLSHYFQAWHLLPGPDVSVVARFFCFFVVTDVRTPCVKIMTTYSAVAWWVNNVLLPFSLEILKLWSIQQHLEVKMLNHVKRSHKIILKNIIHFFQIYYLFPVFYFRKKSWNVNFKLRKWFYFWH